MNLILREAFLLFLVINVKISVSENTIDKHFLLKLSIDSISDWFDTINVQYENLLRYSSYIEWELIVNPSDDLIEKGLELSIIKSNWRNLRCSEGDLIIQSQKDVNESQKRMLYLLCRGPKFTEYQTRELAKVLNHMSDVYSSTRICLPKHFDICKNTDRVWEYTYMKSSRGDFYQLILDGVKPKNYGRHELSKLHFWDGTFDDDYFVFNNEENVDVFGAKTSFICYNGEPELERLMEGGKYRILH